MNELVVMTDVGMPVTNTMAIADGTENDHASVIKLVRTYLADLEEFGGVGFEIQPFETPGGTQRREVAVLNEQQSTLLLTYMRNSDIVRKFKKALVKAFFDLASKARQASAIALPNFTDPAAAAIAWAAEYKAKQAAQAQVLQLEHKVDELAPKAKALDSIANATGLKTIPQAAKPLGVQPEKQLRPYMKAHKWIFWGSDQQYHAFAERIRAGHLKEKDRIITHRDGSQEVKVTVYVTPMGESLLVQRIDDIIQHSKQEKAA